MGQKKFKDFQGPEITAEISKDFQGLENVLSKFKGFQGFSRVFKTCTNPDINFICLKFSLP